MAGQDSLSDVNKPLKQETEKVEELGTSGMGTAEKCRAISELGDFSRSVGGEKCETAEMNESPAFADAMEDAAEGGGEANFAQHEIPSLEMKAVQELDRTGLQAVVTERKMETEGEELLAGVKLETGFVGGFTPDVDAKSEMDVSQPEEVKIETKADQEFTRVVDPEVGLVVAGVDDTQQLSELQMDEAEVKVGDGKNDEASREVENQTVESDKVDEDKVTTAVSDRQQIPESSGEELERVMISAAMMEVDEAMGMDSLGGRALNEPVNIIENKDAVVKMDLSLEEDPEEDIEATPEAEVELELNAGLKESQLADTELVTAEDTELVGDKSPDNNGKMDTEETNSDDEDEALAAEEETGTQDTEMETEADTPVSGKSSDGKQKIGKLSKSPSVSKAATKSSSKKTVGEDVCFICFDGGELVLCDRRGCPKAYHPACVNRDEAFFKSKGQWNCGWHLCSACGKKPHYMCYTCTFSLCKSCTKDAVILCVRGSKGFCEPCMRTVKLIEDNSQENEDTWVDFNDRSSWEFLFKDYYIELKAKLSLSSVDIAEAKNPWKGTDMSSGTRKRESSKAPADANDGESGSDDSAENIETIRPKRRKIKKQSKAPSREYDSGIEAKSNSEWASKELLEFVAHMKDGDTTPLSQFDVQALLLEYIKGNKLRDPRKKSQIICDARFQNLFGKPRVGHFEMLKLLESHFLVRDGQSDDFQGSVVDTESNQLDVDGNADPMTKGAKDKKRKSRKKGDRGPQSNLDDYAAIDMHNIGLIYLRRKLMEDLLEDAEVFNDKVVGTFVRIRISGSNQKQDLYRLVPVVGTSEGAEPYKIAKKSTNTMVEILNLDKTEIISIDTISNQEFTEEECKRLRQSIKCGIISRLTVGEILDKTVEIQTARVNDWLESEVLRLSHLRDRASDLGRRKELRECVEKLQLLKTPEERRRRLDQIPDVHADPKMDPSYESDDNDSDNEDTRRDAFMRSKGITRRGRAPISPGRDNPTKLTNKIWESSKYASGSSFSINPSPVAEIVNECSWKLDREKEIEEPRHSIEKRNSIIATEFVERPSHSVSHTPSAVTSHTPFSAGTDKENAVKLNESEKMWHYKDPSGKVQGPFSMVQLRKWNNTGYFPANLQIWRGSESEDNSLPLANALEGKFQLPKKLPPVDNVMPVANKERSNKDRNSRMTSEKWRGNDTTSLPSPTPIQGKGNKSSWNEEERGPLTRAVHQNSGSVNGLISSPTPTPVLPSMGSLSSAASSVISPVIQPAIVTTAFSPTPTSQPNPPVPLSNIPSPHTGQMHARGPTPGQQGYFWGAPNIQNSSGSFSNEGSAVQPDVWRPAQASQPNIPNASWGAWPVDGNTPIGARPENTNMGWGPLQPNPNMGGGNLSLPSLQPNLNLGGGNLNLPAVNWGLSPPMPLPMPGYGNVGLASYPLIGNVGNGWGQPSGNAGVQVGPPQGGVQVGPPQGSQNQGLGFGQPGNQNHTGGQFSGGRGRDSGFGGGPRPWNGGPPFGGGGGSGGGFWKGGMACPYNQKGRCRKGLQCDYMHT